MKRLFKKLLLCFVSFTPLSMTAAEQFVSFEGQGWLLNPSQVRVAYQGNDKGVIRAAHDLCTDIGKVCGQEAVFVADQAQTEITVSIDSKMKAREKCADVYGKTTADGVIDMFLQNVWHI